jgi:hypothetical protein
MSRDCARPPEPPFLELGLYFRERETADAMAHVFNCLLGLGASPTGSIDAVGYKGARTRRFTSHTEEPLPNPMSVEPSSVSALVEDPDLQF